jgi:hypothetical protein
MDLDAIWNGLVANGIYDIFKVLLWIVWWWSLCKYKNKNITIKSNSKIESSFKWGSKDIDISKSEVKDSFK